MNNGQPVDLGQLRQPSLNDQLQMIQRVMLDSAGLELGGRADLDTDAGPRRLDEIALSMIVAPNGGLVLVGVTGLVGKADDAPGRRVLVLWHSIRRIGAAS